MAWLWLVAYLWLASVVGATLLAHERGNWRWGVALGVLLGPVGVVVAGFMQPSVEVAARRAAAVQKALEQLRRGERLDQRAQKRTKRDLDIRAAGLAAQLFGDDEPTRGT
jgi:MFS family permease